MLLVMNNLDEIGDCLKAFPIGNNPSATIHLISSNPASSATLGYATV